MKCFKLFSQGDHRWLAFTQDDHKPGSVVDTTQVVIVSGRNTMLLDPGGIEIFPSMMGALVHEVDMETVNHIFLSHQDPDVGSALPLWRRVCRDDVRVQVPALWTGFISHFDKAASMEINEFIVPDINHLFDSLFIIPGQRDQCPPVLFKIGPDSHFFINSDLLQVTFSGYTPNGCNDL